MGGVKHTRGQPSVNHLPPGGRFTLETAHIEDIRAYAKQWLKGPVPVDPVPSHQMSKAHWDDVGERLATRLLASGDEELARLVCARLKSS